MFLIILLLTTTVGTAAAVSSAGGGGGGGSSSSAPSVVSSNTSPQSSWNVTQSEADAYRTAEYNAQWGLERIHAAEAYASLEKNSAYVSGLAGAGVKIGIDDEAVLLTHREIDANNSEPWLSTLNNLGTGGHGTHVAATAAGVKRNDGMHGVAYNSQIVSFDTFSNSTRGIAALANDGALVINMSWAFCPSGNCNAPLPVNIGDSNYNNYYASMISEFNVAKNSNGGKGAVLTVANGNEGFSNPDAPSIFSQDAGLSGIMISVAAVDSGNNIAGFSNRCGVAMQYCLSAPGVDIYAAGWNSSTVPRSDSSYVEKDGTSMAAPHVAGAAAVIRGAWSFLTAAQTVQILLNSATDLGAPGVDAIYGHGLLNLYAAVQAQGANTLSSGSSVNSSGYDARSTSMTTSAIFGDSFALNVAPNLNSAVFFDDYGRPYNASLGSKINSQQPTRSELLENLAFNSGHQKNIPLNFGKDSRNQLKLGFFDYRVEDKNPFAAFPTASFAHSASNIFGLKFIMLDAAKDQSALVNNGFSFVRNSSDILPGLKFGFAFNIDEAGSYRQNEFGNPGFLMQNSLASNPYQSFFNTNSASSNIYANTASSFSESRKFNQFFADKTFLNDKLGLKFSYQSSYQSPQFNFALGGPKKQNEALDLGFSFDAKTKLFGQEFNAGKFLISFGSMTEFDNNILNSKSLGGFETKGNVKTSYFKISSNKALAKNLFLQTSISEGKSEIDGNSQGIFRSFNNVRSASSSVSLIYDNFFGGKIGASYVEPMRVYRGSVNIDFATNRDMDGNILRYQTTASLIPIGKEKDFEVFFVKEILRDTQFKINFLTQKERGNIKNAPVNHLGFLQFNKKW